MEKYKGRQSGWTRNNALQTNIQLLRTLAQTSQLYLI
jgi:hypothetical protein